MKKNVLKKVFSIVIIVAMLLYYVPGECYADSQAENTDKREYIISTKNNNNKIVKLKKMSSCDNMFEGSLSKNEVQKLKEEGAVVEKDIQLQASEKKRKLNKDKNKAKETWNYLMINADQGNEMSNSDKKIKIAVLDSGIDLGNTVPKGYYNISDENIAPWYFEDMTGHGTSVSGIIKNIVPNAEIYSVKVLDSDNKAQLSKVVEGIYWCIENDIKVINMSFGTLQYSKILEQAVDAAYKAGIVMVASAGNKGEQGVDYPAAFENVISVGAVDSHGEKTEESSNGKGLDIMAPGKQVVSDGLYGSNIVVGGTSIAAPHVTGAVALILQKNQNVSSNFVKELLLQSAKKIGDKNSTGSGLLDVEYALANYEEFADKYDESPMNNDEILLDKNDAPIETAETDLIEGSWQDHYTLFNEAIAGKYNGTQQDLQKIKLGSVMPDRIYSLKEGMFPTFHGRNNYIANTIALTRLAVKGSSCTANSISSDPTEISNAQGMIKYLRTLSAEQWREGGVSGILSEADKKLYYYGMAIHVATDAVAHHSFGWKDNAWRHGQHTGTYGWADKTGEFPNRYEYSKHIAYRIVRAYVAGNQASYKTFVPDDTALRNTLLNSVTFKMENITRNAKRVNSSVASDSAAMTFFNKYNYNYTHSYNSSTK